MPSTAIVSGILLILLGIVGYVFGLIDGHASLTALIPAAFGILFIILGAAARAKENLRMHLMHAAVLLGIIGFVIPAWRVVSNFISAFNAVAPPINSTESAGIGATSGKILSLAIVSQIAMALICLVFVVLSVKSFIDARRNRTA